VRVLLKEAIDQGADIAGPIRQYITINRKTKQDATEERLNVEPYGRGTDDPLPPSGGGPVLSSKSPHVDNTPMAKATNAPSAPPPPPAGGLPKILTRRTQQAVQRTLARVTSSLSSKKQLKLVEI